MLCAQADHYALHFFRECRALVALVVVAAMERTLLGSDIISSSRLEARFPYINQHNSSFLAHRRTSLSLAMRSARIVSLISGV